MHNIKHVYDATPKDRMTNVTTYILKTSTKCYKEEMKIAFDQLCSLHYDNYNCLIW